MISFDPFFLATEFKWHNKPPEIDPIDVEVNLTWDQPVVLTLDYSGTQHALSIENAELVGRAILAAAQFARDHALAKPPVVPTPTKPKKGHK